MFNIPCNTYVLDLVGFSDWCKSNKEKIKLHVYGKEKENEIKEVCNTIKNNPNSHDAIIIDSLGV